MDSTELIQLGLITLALLFLSAFFSGSETAFFSLSKTLIRSIRERDDAASRRVINLLDKPKHLLIALLIGNTLVNVAIASISAITIDKWFESLAINPLFGLILNIVSVTFVLIIFAEITPKVFALKHNERWAFSVSIAVKLFMILVSPVTKVMVMFVDSISKAIGVESQRVLFSEEELRTIAEVGEEHGVLEEEEREMIHSIFEFSETEAKEIMIPRIDIEALDSEANIGEAKRIVTEKGHSRIPVYDNDIDHIKGILFAKDLIGNNNEEESIKDLIRNAYFVPESKLISDLLKEFQSQKLHMAIVVDEYGGTEGLVTMEDIIEEIVGEIQDEYDKDEVLFKKLDNGDMIVNAKMEVEEFNEHVEEELIPDDEDFESIGGFIFALAGEVPEEGQSYSHEGWEFIVQKLDGNRLLKIKVCPPKDVREASSS